MSRLRRAAPPAINGTPRVERIEVTEAGVVYVAVDANRRKMRIPENALKSLNGPAV